MMKKGSILLLLALCLSLLCLCGAAAETQSGSCGDNVTWTLDENGLLTISGTGPMNDYDYQSPFPTDSVKTAVIENGVTSIGNYSFYCCASLTSITIPDSVTSIDEWAFLLCTSLTSIAIPDSVTSIGWDAFAYCTSLTSVTIPDSVTSIGEKAFAYCTSLTGIQVAPDNPNYCDQDGILFNKNKSILLQYPARKTDKEYEIPDSVTSIDDDAFYYCTSLASIAIPDSVTSIGWAAFGECHALTIFCNKDSYAHTYAIENEIPYFILDDPSDPVIHGICGDNINWTLDENGLLTVSGSGPMRDFSFGSPFKTRSIKTAVIENSVTSIGDNAFEDCTSLTSITIPNSVTSIGDDAFHYCTSLTGIQVAPDNPNYCDQDGILFNKNVSSLLQYPAGKTDTEYEIPDSVTSIGGGAFGNCSSLTSVTIPNSVTSIGWGAFEGCTSLTSVTIPDSVTSIGEWAFYYCTSLTIYGVAGSYAETYAGENGIPFVSISACEHEWQQAQVVASPTETEAGRAVSVCALCGEEKTVTILALRDMNTLYLPADLVRIEEGAFEAVNAQAIIIPDGCKAIEENAFADCASLIYVRIPAGASVSKNAFAGCPEGLLLDRAE